MVLHFLYEMVPKSKTWKSDYYREIGKPGDDIYKKLLGVLDIKKMIPVSETLYKRIVFRDVDDRKYRLLLQKQFRFLLPLKEGILQRAGVLYAEQKETTVVKPMHCNFTVLEKAHEDYMLGVRLR